MLQTSEILEKMNLLGQDGCKLSSTGEVFLEDLSKQKRDELIFKYRLEATFEFQKQPLLLFFNNPTKEKEAELHKWIWNFNKTAVVVIIRENTIDIYNGFSFNQDKKLLNLLKSNFKPEKDSEFNFTNLLSGKTWLDYKDKLSQKHRVDSKLLENLNTVRQLLVEDFLTKNIDENDALETANALIGRLLFIRYLIDRKVKIHFGHYSNEGYLTADDLNTILENPKTIYDLFYYLNHANRYNGDLFPFTKLEKKGNLDFDFSLFIKLFKGADMGKKQLSLFPYYDFSVIPVEFISNVYEQFIGVDNQRKQGAYYTPVFLVDYILNKTVKKHLKESFIAHCPVLDPACGSGIFLVETLRMLIQKYQLLNPNFEQNTEGYHQDLIQLVKENIFGIDRDIKALHVAIFSIYITLLDHQKPADVEKFHFPKLLKTNFFEADFFEINFDEILKSKEFRFILGNPPWGNLSKKDPTNSAYLKYCDQSKIPIGGKEIAQAFIVRVGDIVSPNTDIALIVTSKVLYNLQSVDFRKYFLTHFFLDHILELSSVRKDVFDKVVEGDKQAIAPASVIFYRKASENEDTSENLVLHVGIKPNIFFKTFKTLVIEKRDVQRIRQGLFLKDNSDWLLKVLVYGNILDFYLIKRLKDKNDFKTIGDIVDNDFLVSQGIKQNDEQIKIKKPLGNLAELDLIDTKKDLKAFWINPTLNKWDSKKNLVAYLPDEQIFTPPVLLIAEGVSVDLKSKAAISYNKQIFKASIKAFKPLNEDASLLKNILAFLNSDFFSYYLLMIGSTAAIEREVSREEEKRMIPFIGNKDIIDIISQIEELKKELYHPNTIITLELTYREQVLTKLLNEKVLEAYGLNNEEKALVDYALNISIPIWQNFEKARAILKIQANQAEEELNLYAQIFYDFFKPRFSNNFGIQVYHSDSSIAIRFFHTYEDIVKPIAYYFNQENHIFNHIFKTIGFEKVSQNLFIQKDIRGFDKNSFYIIKPNERKCWHPAVAYLDAYEFGQTLDESKNSLK